MIVMPPLPLAPPPPPYSLLPPLVSQLYAEQNFSALKPVLSHIIQINEHRSILSSTRDPSDVLSVIVELKELSGDLCWQIEDYALATQYYASAGTGSALWKKGVCELKIIQRERLMKPTISNLTRLSNEQDDGLREKDVVIQMLNIDRSEMTSMQNLLIVKLKRAVLGEYHDDLSRLVEEDKWIVGEVCLMGGTKEGWKSGDGEEGELCEVVAGAYKEGGAYNVSELAALHASNPTSLQSMDLYAYLLHVPLVDPVACMAAAAAASLNIPNVKVKESANVPLTPLLQSLHELTQTLLSHDPTSPIPYTSMALWLKCHLPVPPLPLPQLTYTSKLVPPLPEAQALNDDQIKTLDLALHIIDQGLGLGITVAGLLVKAELLEMKQAGAGSSFFKKGLVACGAGSPYENRLVLGLLISHLGSTPNMAAPLVRQYNNGGAVYTFLSGLVNLWASAKDGKLKGLSVVGKGWDMFLKSNDGDMSMPSLCAAIYVQALFSQGSFDKAMAVLTEANERGWGGDAFFKTKMAIALASVGRGEEALVMFHTSIGVGGGEEAKEGMERLEKELRGFADGDEEEEDAMENSAY
ncbi:hypothetical protein TrVE_jg6976 [Triparma verrucosa]|uniref:Uncharacterized protein n=1 Tax=Triparma verrucosa TaxID=1606542 RepID=A0A9W7BKW7_9STRA|nr:hypothetical protein TrVE_jg6976 [Triparma verrucosa]